MARKRFNEREVIETLAWQGVYVPCFRCGHPFYTPAPNDGMWNLTDDIEREHIHEIALGGPDIPKNCRYSCGPCHDKITNGNGATTAGSSANRIAKSKGTRAAKFEVQKRPLDAESVGELPLKCRGCGEQREDCICPPPAPRQSAFARVRR